MISKPILFCASAQSSRQTVLIEVNMLFVYSLAVSNANLEVSSPPEGAVFRFWCLLLNFAASISKTLSTMSEIKLTKSTDGYAVASVGALSEFTGKAFVKDVIGSTGMEMSVTTLAAGEAVPFFHRHKLNEEVYVVISGEGVMMLGSDDVAVAAGSIVLVKPATTRCVKNTGSLPLVMLCIQAKAGSLEGYTATDGELCER